MPTCRQNDLIDLKRPAAQTNRAWLYKPITPLKPAILTRHRQNLHRQRFRQSLPSPSPNGECPGTGGLATPMSPRMEGSSLLASRLTISVFSILKPTRLTDTTSKTVTDLIRLS